MVYDPPCTTDSRVYINGTRIPAGELDLHIRKEGPLDMARYVEGEFASPFDGVDYIEQFEALRSEKQTDFDTLKVELLDETTNEYTTSFHGLVTGVGNAPTGPETWWTFRGQSIELLLNRIDANKTFRDASALDILRYVHDKVQNHVPFDVTLAGVDDIEVQKQTITTLESFASPALGLAAKVSDTLSTPKTFQSNKHSLADVLNWLRDKTDTRIWLEPTDDGVTFVITDDPTARQHDAHYLGGELKVTDNNALTELTPANSILVKGKAKNSFLEYGDFEVNVPANDYVTVKVRHTPLYERAGKREFFASRDVLSDGESKDEVVNEAKSLLKDEIDAPTNGDMEALLRGPIIPYDTVRAQPTCGEYVDDVQPVTYEVERVHHKIRTEQTQDSDGISTTTLNVGVHVSTDDMEIVDSWETEV